MNEVNEMTYREEGELRRAIDYMRAAANCLEDLYFRQKGHETRTTTEPYTTETETTKTQTDPYYGETETTCTG